MRFWPFSVPTTTPGRSEPARPRGLRPAADAGGRAARAAPGALVAIDRASGTIIGSSHYHGYDPANEVIDVGWSFLARAYRGGRYNGEMKRLMLEHAFRWVNTVIFIVGPENRRSQRLSRRWAPCPLARRPMRRDRSGWSMN